MSKRGREGKSVEASGHDPEHCFKKIAGLEFWLAKESNTPLSIGTSRLSFLPPSYDMRLESTGKPDCKV